MSMFQILLKKGWTDIMYGTMSLAKTHAAAAMMAVYFLTYHLLVTVVSVSVVSPSQLNFYVVIFIPLSKWHDYFTGCILIIQHNNPKFSGLGLICYFVRKQHSKEHVSKFLVVPII